VTKRRPTQPARVDAASVAPDDAQAFRAAVADVKPLQHPLRADAVAAHAGRKPKPRIRRRSSAAAVEDLDAVMPLIAVAEDGSPASSPVVGETVLGFQRAGVRIQEMRKLRRGLFPAQDELDLHGFTQAAAREQLANFIVASRDAGLRCVRVIHGKGYRNGGRGAVLKTAVDSWLRRHMDVLAFASAKAIDGGTGALYVLLRG
jgi:DNA-nicking Smr family endonuclease